MGWMNTTPMFVSLLLAISLFAFPASAQTADKGKKNTVLKTGKAPAAVSGKKMQKGVLQPPKTPTISRKERFALISIEEKVSSLKERIFRSKARLMLLEERVLRGALTTAKIFIHHKNEMSSSFYMTQASYILDGRPIFFRKDYNGSLNKVRKFKVFEGTLQPGPHTLDVKLRYRGHGYGIFSYLRGYKFELNRRASFQIKAGNSISISMIAFEKNPLTTKLTQRPDLRFKTNIRRVYTPRANFKKMKK